MKELNNIVFYKKDKFALFHVEGDTRLLSTYKVYKDEVIWISSLEIGNDAATYNLLQKAYQKGFLVGVGIVYVALIMAVLLKIKIG